MEELVLPVILIVLIMDALQTELENVILVNQVLA
jgi:hypothetical protein